MLHIEEANRGTLRTIVIFFLIVDKMREMPGYLTQARVSEFLKGERTDSEIIQRKTIFILSLIHI